MTQEEKDLLLKDLCARLPYGVKFMIDETYLTKDMITGGYDKTQELYGITCEGNVELLNMDYHMPVESIKPYLFPLSSMTEEQYKEWGDLAGEPLDEILTRNAKDEIMSTLEHHLLVAKSSTDPVNYCYKNHFDIYGLIEKGLAIDATGLNIY